MKKSKLFYLLIVLIVGLGSCSGFNSLTTTQMTGYDDLNLTFHPERTWAYIKTTGAVEENDYVPDTKFIFNESKRKLVLHPFYKTDTSVKPLLLHIIIMSRDEKSMVFDLYNINNVNVGKGYVTYYDSCAEIAIVIKTDLISISFFSEDCIKKSKIKKISKSELKILNSF